MSAHSTATQSGTRVLIFPQPPFLDPIEAETVYLSTPAGGAGAGPCDARMYVVDPLGKQRIYGLQPGRRGRPDFYLPPWDGDLLSVAEPGRDGHFDHLRPGTREFEAAHLYGCARWTLDVWEGYFGRRIDWHFARDFERMELVLLDGFDNAQVGYGFLEVGGHTTRAGEFRPFSLNFDVIAHEVGHAIIYSEVGVPAPGTEQGEYFGFHESAADLVALIAVLHFDSVTERLLDTTGGNLYTLNRLNRFAELSDNEQIRIAGNGLVLSDFAGGWQDEHDLAQPLTGAMFDVLVDIFHESLLERNLISAEVEHLADEVEGRPEHQPLIQALFDEAYARNPPAFKEALLEARDVMGTYLADTWARLTPDHLDYGDVAAALKQVDRDLLGGRYRRLIARNLRRREIGRVAVGPRLRQPHATDHSHSTRVLVPEFQGSRARLPYATRMRLGGGPTPAPLP